MFRKGLVQFLPVVFLLPLIFSLPTPAVAKDLVPAGTIITCILDEPNFSSKTAQVGDPVLCSLGPLRSFGHMVFPRGAQLSGHLQDYKNPGHFWGKGSLSLEFDRVILPNAEVLPLNAKIISAPHQHIDKAGSIKGKGHPKRDAILWAVPLFWPVKVLTLPARGPYPTLKGETRLSMRRWKMSSCRCRCRQGTPYPRRRGSTRTAAIVLRQRFNQPRMTARRG